VTKLFNKKYIIFFLIPLLVGQALALDFLAGDQINPLVEKGYKVKSDDTFGGYAVHAPEGDWKIYHHAFHYGMYGVTKIPMPRVSMSRVAGKNFLMAQWIQIATLPLSAGVWSGDPCAGSKIIKIMMPHGGHDRCAVAEIQSMKIGSVPTDTLKIMFIETNNNGRYYRTVFNIHFENMGYTRDEVSDPGSDFNVRLKAWMSQFLDGVVAAAKYDKPGDAFNGVPAFADAMRPKKQ
jgi:hypothetical protein